MNQRLERIDGLHPVIQRPALKLIEQCEAKLGRKLLVVWGFRSVHDQLRIYQQGRTFDRENAVWVVTDENAIVTKSMPGTSAHNVVTIDGKAAAMGFDVIPFLPDGSPDWNVDQKFWLDLYPIAWKLGLDPLGDKVGSYLAGDMGHFEEPAWRLKIDGLACYMPTNIAPASVNT